MKSQKEIISILTDGSKWPDIYHPEFLEELNTVADNLFSKKTLEGYIASILIYHQIAEEMIKALINISAFYSQSLNLHIYFKDREVDKKMFGQLINELDYSLKLENTDYFIQKCKELNEIRINIVHKMTKKKNITEIQKICKKSKRIFDEIYELFEDIYDEWRLCLKDIAKEYL